MIYCLRDPKGNLIEETAATNVLDCWDKAFWVLCERIEGYKEKYWKKLESSKRASKKHGYDIVKCKLVIIK